MKLNILSNIALSIIMSVGVAKADFFGSRNDEEGYSRNNEYDHLPLEIERCSQDLYVELNVQSSTADRACFKRIDWIYHKCLINLTKKMQPDGYQDSALERASKTCAQLPTERLFDPEYKLSLFTSCSSILGNYLGDRYAVLTGQYCNRAKTYQFALCAVTMGQSGITEGPLFEKVCNSDYAQQVTDCIIANYQKAKINGHDVLATCGLQLGNEIGENHRPRNPVVTNPQEIEDQQEKIEQEKRREEEKKRLEAEAAKKAKKDKQTPVGQGSAKSDDSKSGKKESSPKTAPTPAPVPAPKQPQVPAPAPAPAPQDPQNGDDGVIVDLPNF